MQHFTHQYFFFSVLFFTRFYHAKLLLVRKLKSINTKLNLSSIQHRRFRAKSTVQIFFFISFWIIFFFLRIVLNWFDFILLEHTKHFFFYPSGNTLSMYPFRNCRRTFCCKIFQIQISCVFFLSDSIQTKNLKILDKKKIIKYFLGNNLIYFKLWHALILI